MLGQAIGSFRFVGIATASEIEAEERASACQAFGNADEVHVGSGQAVQSHDRGSAAWPITEGESHTIPRHATVRRTNHLDEIALEASSPT